MKVLGISGSPRKGSNTDRLVQEVLSTIDTETEFVSLAGMKIAPCKACLKCVEDNICKINDDMHELRGKIAEADAYVIGGANYFSMLNGQTHNFLERFYQFRHREGRTVAGKLGIAVGVGGRSGDPVIENIKTFFLYNDIECLGSVSAQGAANCFICGYGETCKAGAIHRFLGAGTKITPSIVPDISKQAAKLEVARVLGRKLGERLKSISQKY